MKKNLLYRLGKTLSLVEGCRCCRKSSCRHPEFISGSQESKGMLNPVQHDGRNDCYPATHHCHPELDSGSQEGREMLKQAQYDGYSMGQASNPPLYDGWYRPSLSLGRSMIEMLGVLAIIGVLSIGVLYAYRQAMIRMSVNKLGAMANLAGFAFKDLCSEEEICPFKRCAPDCYSYNRQLLCDYAGGDFCAPSIKISGSLKDSRWVFCKANENNRLSGYFLLLDISPQYCSSMLDFNFEGLYRITAHVRILNATGTDKWLHAYPVNGKLTEEQRRSLKEFCSLYASEKNAAVDLQFLFSQF